MSKSRLNCIADIAGADDWGHDPWGTAMELLFNVAAVLDMSDIKGDITPEPFARWDYRRAPYSPIPSIETVAARGADYNEGEWADDYTYGQIMLATAIETGELSQDDLIYAGNVLSRYTDLLRLAGKDY